VNNRTYLKALSSVAADLQTMGQIELAKEAYRIQILLEKEYERENLMGHSKKVIKKKKKKAIKRLSRYDIAKI
jgi:TfoX/Sxy family transcriptional regulator of competence genes